MGHPDEDTRESDAWLKAVAWTPPVAPFTGTDRYRVIACLGEGGFGVVYDVEDRALGRSVALKTLKPERSGFAANIQRLKREFRSVADLVHPNLVGLHELASAGDRWFFTMDLVRGTDFRTYVRSDRASEPRLRSVVGQLVAGVAALHQAGIVHRDLKPSNVLVEPEGRVVILDFGLAGAEDAADPDLARGGTPAYMAPEQAAGQGATPAADWYAVGVMLYEALTGVLPADERVPPSLVARVPADLERVCLELLRRDPGKRPDATAIVAALGTVGSVDARPVERGAPFVGRTTELGALRAAYATVARGEPRLVRVFGEPGVGKSALVARFLAEARADGAVVLDGKCHERESVPFKAFDGVIDALVRYLAALPRNEAAAVMPRDVHLVTHLFPVLDGVAAVGDVPRRLVHRSDPRDLRLRAFAAIKELIGRIADKQPLVIAIDDLQWGDADSARLLAHLIALPQPPAMMLVLCHRDEDNVTLREFARMLAAAGGTGVEVPIAVLPPADAEALAAALLGTERDGGVAARTIAQRGEGHPLFISELARAVDRGGAATAPTLIDILWQRVARLSDGARALLETIAIAGQPIAPALCFDAAGIGGGGIDAIRVLRAEQLVRAGDVGAVTVFHDRIRDAVLLRADVGTQRERHLALACSLERDADADPEAVARHFDAADARDQAARYAARAGEAAMAGLAFDRAAALFQMAIERGTATAALHEQHGDALLNAGHNLAAGEAYLAGAALAEGDHATDLLRRGAEQLLMLGDVERGYRALDRAMVAVDERLPATLRRAQLEMIYHMIRLRLGGRRFRECAAGAVDPAQLLRIDVLDSATRGLDPNDPARAMALAFRFSRRALASGDPRRIALGLIRAVFGYTGGHPTKPAIIGEILDEAEAIGTRIGAPEVNANAALMRQLSDFVFCDWPGVVAHGLRTVALITEQCTGMAAEQRLALLNVISGQLRMGVLAPARDDCDRLLLDAVERGDPVSEKNVCAGGHAWLSLADDDVDGARRFLDRSQAEDRCISVMMRAEATASIVTYAAGDVDDGVDAWRSRWKLLDDMGVFFADGFRSLTARSLGIALARRGRPDDVRELARLARWLRRSRVPCITGTRAHLQALVAMLRGKPDAAVALLDRAALDYDRATMPIDAAACRFRVGELAGDRTMMAAARGAVADRGFADPERWIAMLVPAVTEQVISRRRGDLPRALAPGGDP